MLCGHRYYPFPKWKLHTCWAVTPHPPLPPLPQLWCVFFVSEIFKIIFIYWAARGVSVFTVACRIFSCSMWDGTQAPCIGTRSLSPWTTREVPLLCLSGVKFLVILLPVAALKGSSSSFYRFRRAAAGGILCESLLFQSLTPYWAFVTCWLKEESAEWDDKDHAFPLRTQSRTIFNSILFLQWFHHMPPDEWYWRTLSYCCLAQTNCSRLVLMSLCHVRGCDLGADGVSDAN